MTVVCLKYNKYIACLLSVAGLPCLDFKVDVFVILVLIHGSPMSVCQRIYNGGFKNQLLLS